MTVGDLDKMIDANRAMCVGREKTVGLAVTIEVVGFDHWRAQRPQRQRKRLGNARSVAAVRPLLSGGISILAHSGPEWNRNRSGRLRHDNGGVGINFLRRGPNKYKGGVGGVLGGGRGPSDYN